MNYISVGPESSGTKWVAKYIALSLGVIKKYDDWDGNWEVENEQHKVIHRSLPHSERDNFIDLEDFGNPDNLKVVICIRDRNIAKKSALVLHNRGNNALAEKMLERARKSIIKFINSDYDCYLFSYETATYLKDEYFKLLAQHLNIPHVDIPIRNENLKYLKP